MPDAARLPVEPAERLQALQAIANDQADAASLLPALAAQLPSAAALAAVFASVEDAPQAPATPDQAQAAASLATATAAHLRLLEDLAAQLDASQLGLSALALSGSGGDGGAAEDVGPPGSVRIEELDAAEPSPDLAVTLVLAATLYGGAASLGRPWAEGEVAAAAARLLAALAAKLEEAPGGMQPQSAAGAAAPLLQEVAVSRSGGGDSGQGSAGQGQGRQPEAVQRLLALAMGPVLQRLRPVVVAKLEHSKHNTARLEPYTGPDDFERCVAAGQLAWALRQLGGRHLGSAIGPALPLVLAAVEDPSPAVQACGLWALRHVALEGPPAGLRPHAALMLHAAKRALAGCSDASWQAAAAAATAVVGCLSGSGPYSQANHEVMTILLDEGELGAHKAERAVAWLASALPLFPRLGLQLAAHFGRLMPLLLGWCLAPQHAVRVAALGALLQAVQLTWPRVGAHAAPVWGVLRRARADALQRRPAAGAAPGAAAADKATLAEDCGVALWYAAGVEFQVQLMTAREAPQDELLQAVMQRLEDGAHVPTPMEDGAPGARGPQQGQPMVQAA